jgi:dihydroorotate dehydrogenase (fumarate)
MDLSVKHLGLTLKNPIIVGSSGLTSSVSKIKSLEKAGAAAVVLKSIFEEQIEQENWSQQVKNKQPYVEALDYIETYSNDKSFTKYLQLIKDAKKEVNIPIIASINCISEGSWIEYAKKIEEAGADALELNVAILPSDIEVDSTDNEKSYFNITEKVKKAVNIPISLKMSNYSAGLAKLITELSWTGNVDSFVLFNRYFRPDIDIDTLEIKSQAYFSTSDDIIESLRWVLILSKKLKKEIVANTGIHTGKDVIKQLLAGATAVQVVSEIYQNGEGQISSMLKELETWMELNKHSCIDDFRGKLHQNEDSSKGFERIQFMKYYGGIE